LSPSIPNVLTVVGSSVIAGVPSVVGVPVVVCISDVAVTSADPDLFTKAGILTYSK
jgi:hypothetical protein